MRHYGDIKVRTLENILGWYIQVSTVQLYKYKVREEKGIGQKVTNTGKGWLEHC